MTRRICLALDLVEDKALIAEYLDWHRPGRAPRVIVQTIHDSGIEEMEIYCIGNRLFMIIDAKDDFSAERKATADAANPAVQKWVVLMKQYQQPVPAAGPSGTWIEMDRVYRMSEHLLAGPATGQT